MTRQPIAASLRDTAPNHAPVANSKDGVLHADHGNWLYFLTVPGGKSQFSSAPLKGQ